MDQELLHGSLAENVLIVLCFYDDEAQMIRNSVSPDLFESSVFQRIARVAIEYGDQYSESPKEHLPDLLEDSLRSSDDSTARLYDKTLENLFEAQTGVNPTFVLNKLSRFVREQNLKILTLEAMKSLKDGDLDEAESIISKSLGNSLDLFHPGLFFNDPVQSLRFLRSTYNSDNIIRTGIQQLDADDICPARKEFFLVLAPPNRGKTWTMVHLGKNALLQRFKVLHITLEMEEDKIAQRYIQNLFSVSKRKAQVLVPRLLKTENGKLESLEFDEISRPAFDEIDIAQVLRKKLKRVSNRLNLVIKQFPPRTLSIKGIETYLDGLDRMHKFQPDVLILDYADDMYINPSNIRTETMVLYKELRKIAVERNLAMISASQANRAAERAKVITLENFAEDYSKGHTADNVISYNQTLHEKQHSLARLFVAKGRNDRSGQLLLISQSYTIGQFCLDSVMMNKNYWDMLSILDQESEENV